MIVNIQDEDEASFLRHFSERVWDQVQFAQIEAIEAHLVLYAMTAWRPMNIEPPFDVLVTCACEDGLQLMSQSKLGEWRTNAGLPHKAPLAWMPCPVLPNGSFKKR